MFKKKPELPAIPADPNTKHLAEARAKAEEFLKRDGITAMLLVVTTDDGMTAATLYDDGLHGFQLTQEAVKALGRR